MTEAQKYNIRFQLVLSQQTAACLDTITGKLDSASKSETIRRALGLLSMVLENQLNNGTTLIRAPDGTEKQILVC